MKRTSNTNNTHSDARGRDIQGGSKNTTSKRRYYKRLHKGSGSLLVCSTVYGLPARIYRAAGKAQALLTAQGLPHSAAELPPPHWPTCSDGTPPLIQSGKATKAATQHGVPARLEAAICCAIQKMLLKLVKTPSRAICFTWRSIEVTAPKQTSATADNLPCRKSRVGSVYASFVSAMPHRSPPKQIKLRLDDLVHDGLSALLDRHPVSSRVVDLHPPRVLLNVPVEKPKPRRPGRAG